MIRKLANNNLDNVAGGAEWKEDHDGDWCYLNEDGIPLVGFQEIDGVLYYFDKESGKLTTGWKEIAGNWYYFVDDAIGAKGWKGALVTNGARP